MLTLTLVMGLTNNLVLTTQQMAWHHTFTINIGPDRGIVIRNNEGCFLPAEFTIVHRSWVQIFIGSKSEIELE